MDYLKKRNETIENIQLETGIHDIEDANAISCNCEIVIKIGIANKKLVL